MSSQTDLENWIIERGIHGWLGKTPPEIADAPPDLVKRWKDLSRRAGAVARMRFGQRKIDQAKEVERLRAALIQEAKDRKR